MTNKQMKDFWQKADDFMARMDGDFSVFIADVKITETWDSNGEKLIVKTPYLYITQ